MFLERPFDVKINTRSITSVLITNCDWPTKFPGLKYKLNERTSQPASTATEDDCLHHQEAFF